MDHLSQRPAPPPVHVDGVRMFGAGTVLWAIAAVVMLILWATDRVDLTWLMVCVTGVVTGLIGVAWARRRLPDEQQPEE